MKISPSVLNSSPHERSIRDSTFWWCSTTEIHVLVMYRYGPLISLSCRHEILIELPSCRGIMNPVQAERLNSTSCYIAGIFSPTAHALVSYFEATWNPTIKFFLLNCLWVGNTAKCMTSELNSALLPANVHRWPPLHVNLLMWTLCYVTNHLMTGSSRNQLI